ncbi:uncharacterized protein at2g39795 mitochondrial [Phtheirospermum japonicum]|uniref:Uncharacterized protein at2g39795 mitochondrial n=1 Tax=Phtheirospermum japonicum TaxID=374723 RepID=A0A830D6A7_9LAMI|nr:uncharacterized protein at2g39795 mitochondrial [Phtheirospermum japonicum]
MIGGALINGCRRRSPSSIVKLISSAILCRGTHNTCNAYSPSESKLQRLLSTEIQYQCDYAPPHQPVTEYGRFMVEDRPGEQSVTMRGKSSEDENIKIEAAMFDGIIVQQKAEGQENVHLHISMSVDIWKGEGTNNSNSANAMKFVCSAWPNTLEIQKVFMCRHDDASPPARLYMGPQFKNLNTRLQIGFYEFLNTRGVNDGLSMFLHKYMMNKDRIELIQWLGKLNCFLKT